MNRASAAPVLLYAGLLVAMVGGAPWPRPNWLIVVVGIAVIVVGIVAKRSAESASLEGSSSGPGASGGASDHAVLADLAARVKALVEEVATAELGVIATRVTELQQGPVTTFSATQDEFVRRHGFQAWATVMAPLATGERLLFRAWSAASDGHRGETVASMQQALPYVEEAAQALAEITSKRS